MTVNELHPDELLRRARRGELSDVEARQLAVHVEGCSVCAIERLAAADFATETAPAAGDAALLAGMIDAITVPAAGTASHDAGRTAHAAKPALRSRSWSRWLLVAAVVSVGALAAAAVRELHRATPAPSSPLVQHALAHAPPVTAPVPVAAPVGPVAPPSEPVAPSPRAPVHASLAPSARAVDDAVPDSAASLYARANHARRDGDPADAASGYRTLQRRFPDSPQALQSYVALGRVLLDRLGDPASALVAFDRYLAGAPRGDESEAALVGRALALRRLHRSADERHAWAALLHAFPDSMYADTARASIAASGTAP